MAQYLPEEPLTATESSNWRTACYSYCNYLLDVSDSASARSLVTIATIGAVYLVGGLSASMPNVVVGSGVSTDERCC